MVLAAILETEPDNWRQRNVGNTRVFKEKQTIEASERFPFNNGTMGHHHHSHLPYYHPDLADMPSTRQLMTRYIMQDGAFLLRNSFSQPGKLTVTVMHCSSIKHFSLGTHQGRYMIQNQLFETVKDLIDFYRLHDVPNDEAVEHLRLVHPILYRPSGGQKPGRSQSFATGATRVTPLMPVAPEHRYSVDANMADMRYHTTGLLRPDPTPAPPPPAMRRVSTSSHGSTASLNSVNSTGPSSPTSPLSLPIPKPKKEHKFGFMKFLKRRHNGGGGVREQAPAIAERGPAPLPTNHATIPDPNSPYYSIVKPEVDRHAELIENLRLTEESVLVPRCECGLTVEEAELPCGWTMHLSQEPGTEGLLFFMGPENETTWEVPFSVMLQLTADQQDALRSWAEKGRLPMRSRKHQNSNGSSNCSSGDRSSFGSSTSGGSCPGSSSRPTSLDHLTSNITSQGRQPTEHECTSDDAFPAESSCRL